MTTSIGGVTDLPDPISRRDRQRQTREAVVLAARASFARDGYHGARLDEIARAAGFSKGAVYSNFSSKAELFLAVMDANIDESMAGGGWDLFERRPVDLNADDELTASIRGFALATLEFVAYAARDEALRSEVARRIGLLPQVYGAAVEATRAARAERGVALTDDLTAEQVGALLAAFDQGAAALALAGSRALDPELLQAGMARLLQPHRLSDEDMEVARSEVMRDPAIRERLVGVEIVRRAGDTGAAGD